MIISVHLPKTAGSSFATSLNEHFGDKLLKDYDDLPLHQTNINRNRHAITQASFNYFKDYRETQCIHGHFLPLKYRFNKDSTKFQFVTWMRDPAERLASQYYYMKRHYSPERALKQPLLKKITDEDWSLEKFCFSNELKNTYSKFLWGFPFDSFDFIGIVENYDKELNYFSTHIIKAPLISHHQNQNPKTPKSYFKDSKFKEDVAAFHNKDYILYNKALIKMKDRHPQSNC